MRCIHYKNTHYLIPIRSSEIIKYDENTQKYSRITEWYEMIKSYVNSDDVREDDAWDLLPNSLAYKNHMLLPFSQANIVIDINMDTDVCCIHQIGNVANRYQDIAFDGHDFWLLSRTASILTKWNYDTSESEACRFSFGNVNPVPYLPYNEISCNRGLIHLYPGQYHHHTILNITSGEVIEHAACDGTTLFVQNCDNGEIFLESKFPSIYLNGSRLIFEIDGQEKKTFFLDREQFKKCFSINSVGRDQNLFEGYRIDLYTFIDECTLAVKCLQKGGNSSIAGRLILQKLVD